MRLVQIDVVRPQALQRAINRAAYVGGRKATLARPHLEPDFRGDEHPRAQRGTATGQPLTEHVFGLTALFARDEPHVGVRRVDEDEARLDKSVEQRE